MIPQHPHPAGARATRLHAALATAFPGAEIAVRDDSHRHAGHSGARPGGETHYAVRVVWPGFQGQSRVARQRAVNAALAEEFADGMHALAIEAKAPGEG
ncbi:BolA family transcriptional regulator [Roseomonas gilardii subsp. gilardii]|uniref:BolA family protein n=1 Tax=Roseomonas gilardii TaxID=257708 RepID=UPI001FF8A858|nr:BolA family protein [Roseomonas gilardii]UPG72185.1 BolA family transcriptional regulator [Roseomonas gilardii subsp. gilardii]